MHRQIAGSLAGPVTKWLAFGIVILLTGFMAYLGSNMADAKNNEASSWLPGDAESTKVADELAANVDPNDIPTLVVFTRPSGLTDADLAAMDAMAAEIGQIDGITADGVFTPNASIAAAAQGAKVPPLISEDREVAYLYFVLNFGKSGWESVPAAADEVRDIAKLDGVDVFVSGYGGQAADFSESFEESQGALVLITFSVVILILLLTYRSPILWLLPILSAGVSIMVGTGVVYLLAKYAGLTVNDQTLYIMDILIVGAGTDYALLLVARYREELRKHENRHEAMAVALHRAAPAILASGATVVAGLLCLVLADLNSTSGMGPALAVAVACTVFVMLTFLPAMLVIFGRWIFWPKRPTYRSFEPTTTGFWARLGDRMAKGPRRVWITTAVLLAVACLGLFRLDTDGLTTSESVRVEFESVAGVELMAEHGLADSSNTVQVVTNDAQLAAVEQAVASVPGAGDLTDPESIGGGRSYFEASLSDDVASPEAFAVVEGVREAVHDVEGADALAGGGAAFYLDTKVAASRDNKVIIPIVLVVILLILIALLRSVVAPLLLIGTVVLSFAAALGISALLFEYVFGFAGADPGLPLFAFVFLVALGVDYNIFLMTRVREETSIRGTRAGSLAALASTGGVITSAGLVLAATFSTLITLPLVFMAEIGTVVALGVLLDTFIVRSVLVTALNLDLGGKIWWPSRLDRAERVIEPPVADTGDKELSATGV
jgi:RND superfamily putative drug exporter